MRVPQNGGVAIGWSAATSERSGMTTGSASAARLAAIRSLRARRSRRSAALAAASED